MPLKIPIRPRSDPDRGRSISELNSALLWRNETFSPSPPDYGYSVTSTSGVASEPALVVEHLTKEFGDRTAFSDVSFDVAYGEVFGFLGPNGAGKTTTVRALGTLIAPTSGSATVA